MQVTPFYSKKVECFNCDNNFSSTKIRSRFIRISSHETDFKPVYTKNKVNPLYYNVTVCPLCGFSFTDEFSPYFAPETREAIQQQITSKWNGRSYGDLRDVNEAIDTYKLAYLSALYKKEKPITIAGLTLRIAWLYREKELLKEEINFLTIARDLYINSYSEGDHVGTQMSETRVLYLIAELSRRIGDEKEAIKSFSQIIEQQRTSTEPNIIEMAKERWREMREV